METCLKKLVEYYLSIMLNLRRLRHFIPTKWRSNRDLDSVTSVPILSVFRALIVHSELKSVHAGFPVAFIFKHKLINK